MRLEKVLSWEGESVCPFAFIVVRMMFDYQMVFIPNATPTPNGNSPNKQPPTHKRTSYLPPLFAFLIISSTTFLGTFDSVLNSMVNSPCPCVLERSSVL